MDTNTWTAADVMTREQLDKATVRVVVQRPAPAPVK